MDLLTDVESCSALNDDSGKMSVEDMLVDAVLDVLDEVRVDMEVLVGVEVPDCNK